MISPLNRVAKSTASYLGFAGARGTDDGNEGLHG